MRRFTKNLMVEGSKPIVYDRGVLPVENPQISIIIPVYNGSNYMREAIDSALAQTYDNFEVLVVNDGSNDGGATREIALSYGDSIRYFEKENGGVATALNLAIREMKGEYFSWLSHDDLYYPHKLSVQMRAILERGDRTAISYGNYDSLNMFTGEKEPTDFLAWYPLERLESSVFPIFYSLIQGCSLLIHKSHFDRVGAFDESLLTSQDYDMWFRMFRGQKLVFVPQSLICSRVHSEQGTRTMECFRAESGRFFSKASLSLSGEELIAAFGHAALFYYRAMYLFRILNLPEICQILMKRYAAQKLPKEIGRQIAEWLRGQGAEKICIFCAGAYGKHMRFILSDLGIPTDCFSDNNPSLWGRQVEGIPCISLDELKKISRNTLIIVSLSSYPASILSQLKQMGCPHVTTEQLFEKKLFDAVSALEQGIVSE